MHHIWFGVYQIHTKIFIFGNLINHVFVPVSLLMNRPAIKSQQTEHTEEVRLANNSYSNYLIDNQIIANYLVDIYIRLLSHIVSLLFIENETLLHLALLCHALPSTKNVKNSDQNFQGYGKVQNICHQSEILQLDGDKMSVEQNIYYQPEILQLGGDKMSVEVPYGHSLVVNLFMQVIIRDLKDMEIPEESSVHVWH